MFPSGRGIHVSAEVTSVTVTEFNLGSWSGGYQKLTRREHRSHPQASPGGGRVGTKPGGVVARPQTSFQKGLKPLQSLSQLREFTCIWGHGNKQRHLKESPGLQTLTPRPPCVESCGL